MDTEGGKESVRQRYVVERVDAISYGKITAIGGAIIGFLVGLVTSLVISIFGLATSHMDIPNLPVAMPGLITFLGLAAVVIYPIIYGVFGFILGAISALIYNAAARWVGGIEVDLRPEEA